MARTTVKSGQLRDLDILIDDFRDFGVEDSGGLDVNVKAGRIRNDNTITDKSAQPLTLTNGATNYVEIDNAGVASFNTTGFTSGRIPLATVVTAGGDITSLTDKRSWTIIDNTGVTTTPGTLSATTKSLWLSLMNRAIKEDQTSSRSANEDGDMRVDVFTDDDGIDAGLSTGYTHRTTPNFDVIATPAGISLFRPGDITSNLQGYWKLDESSGNRSDSSSNGNTLTDNNTVASVSHDFWRTGENSADFESANSEYLSITDAAQTGLDLTGNLSFSAIVRIESLGSDRFIIDKRNGAGTSGYYFRINADGTLGFATASSSTSSTGILTIGRWYHVGLYYDGTNVVFFIDGNIDRVVAYSTNPTDNSENFVIGRRNALTDSYFDGLLKDVAVWSSALTSLQMKSLALGYSVSSFAYRPDDVSPSPDSWWKLNEISSGAGAITRNDSIGSNHLTDNNTTITGSGYIEGAGADFESANSEYLNAGDVLDITGTYSMCAWFKPESVTITQVFIGKSDGTTGYQWGLNTSGKMFVKHETTTYTDTGNALVTGVWYHLAVTYDTTNNEVKFFVDGKLNSTIGSATVDPTNTTHNFHIGRRSSTDYVDGILSDVAIWTTSEISDASIASLASGVPLQTSGMVSYWKLDESSGTRADSFGSNDLSDNNSVTSETNARTGRTMASFNGTNQYLSITDASQVGLEDSVNFSVTFWHTPDVASGQRHVVSKGSNSTSTEYNYRMDGANNHIWEIGQTGGLNNPTITTVTANSDYFNAGVWFGNGARMVADNTALGWRTSNEGVGTKNGTFAGNAKTFVIGAENEGASAFYDGGIGDVTWWSRNLRDDELKSIFLKGLNNKDVTSSEVSPPAASADVISTAYTLSEVPTRAMIKVNKTLNTGSITFYVSRVSSPGTNLADTTKWTPVSENTITDITGQSSGSSGRWAAEITGDAELDDITVVFGKAVV